MATNRGSTGSSSATTWEDVAPRYREAWGKGSSASSTRWEDAEPGYRYVHEMGTDPRFEGRKWSEVEPELEAGYASWAQQRGYQGDRAGWRTARRGAQELWEGGNPDMIQLREEELRARKRMIQTGEVKIRTDVVEERKTIEVPVTREEVTIERRPVDRQPAEGRIGDSEVIEVPIREEQVSVEKQAVVYEELDVDKRTVQDTETVSDTVRREVADVRTEGDLEHQSDGGASRRDR